MVAGAVSKCYGTHGTGTTVLTVVISAILYFIIGLILALVTFAEILCFFYYFYNNPLQGTCKTSICLI